MLNIWKAPDDISLNQLSNFETRIKDPANTVRSAEHRPLCQAPYLQIKAELFRTWDPINHDKHATAPLHTLISSAVLSNLDHQNAVEPPFLKLPPTRTKAPPAPIPFAQRNSAPSYQVPCCRLLSWQRGSCSSFAD